MEASWRHDDCAAIGYVLKARAKRSRWSFARTAIAYSAIDADTPRARMCSQLPNGPFDGWTEASNKRWSDLRVFAAKVVAGKAPNPCPGATHFGARDIPSDVRRAISATEAGRWRVVQCSTVTANAYYSEVSRELARPRGGRR